MSRRSEVSAGILAFRRRSGLELLLAHPGGPYWRSRDEGAWSIPKGMVETDDVLACARREFNEETGLTAAGPFTALTPIRQKSGKTVHAFAVEADFDLTRFSSNKFDMEWPPRSGKLHVLKGASFTGDAKNATYMTHAAGPGNGFDVGFRVVMEPRP